MNDDFLYRVRTQPPAHFAAALKARLDRPPRRHAQVLRVGLGVLLFGTAFAVVSPDVRRSIVTWVRGEDTQVVGASDGRGSENDLARAERALDSASAGAEAEVPTGNGATSGDAGGIGRRVARRPAPVQRNPLATSAIQGESESRSAEELLGAIEDAIEPANTGAAEKALQSSQGASTGFIVTGPLLAEHGTAAHAFEMRQSTFTLMVWALEPLEEMARRPDKFYDVVVAETSARRLELLTQLMHDAFRFDPRGSNVRSRSRDEVWSQPDEFERREDNLADAVGYLRRAVQIGDPGRRDQALSLVKLACTECHNAFREGGDKDVGLKDP